MYITLQLNSIISKYETKCGYLLQSQRAVALTARTAGSGSDHIVAGSGALATAPSKVFRNWRWKASAAIGLPYSSPALRHSLRSQRRQLLVGLDPLGVGHHAEAVGQVDHRPDDGRAVGSGSMALMNERSILILSNGSAADS